MDYLYFDFWRKLRIYRLGERGIEYISSYDAKYLSGNPTMRDANNTLEVFLFIFQGRCELTMRTTFWNIRCAMHDARMLRLKVFSNSGEFRSQVSTFVITYGFAIM